ncbi:MAG: HNH endonuclease [Clostridia bacterium]|nr:HNH endonuclease [Clostridia bacterium]
MKDLKLKIELLPKGAWGNDFSRTLSKKDWDVLRKKCYERANHKCQICGFTTDDLDAHEVWNFDINTKTQTLIDIVALCSKCHGVKHIRNSQRLGYGENAKRHFMNVNNCNELEFASHLTKAQLDFEERNQIYRWKMVANLDKFGGEDIEIKQRNIPFIENSYQNIDWNFLSYKEMKNLFEIKRKNNNLISVPKINYIEVDNYQGTITISSLYTNKIEWYLDGFKIKTKFNIIGEFYTTLKVENLVGKDLNFILIGDNGQTVSKTFVLLPQEVL